jgi:hypothetical protein
MPWSFIIPAAVNLIGGNKQAEAAQGAADTTAAATREQTALQRRMYEENIARQKPFYDVGVNALNQYVSGIQPGAELTRGFTMADYQADPGYAFRLQEGLKALDRTAAARGGLLSGNALRGATQFGQNLASEEFGNAYNRFINQQNTRRNALAGLAGYGPTTAQTLGAAGQTMANNVGALGMQQAVNQANANLLGTNYRATSYGEAANQLGKVNWSGFGDWLGGKVVPESPYY